MDELSAGSVWPLAPLIIGIGIWLGAWRWDYSTALSPGAILIPPLLLLLFLPPIAHHPRARQIALLLILFTAGFLRLGSVYAGNETLPFERRYYGPIEGRIVKIDQSSSGALRLTLDQVELDGRAVHGQVRISLHGPYNRERMLPAAMLQTTGHLSPPSGPAEPGGYDFRKRAWADGLAAVGYSRKPAMASDQGKRGPMLWLLDFRLNQSAKYRERLGDNIGGFAAAIFVGDRSAGVPEIVSAMRQSNLAHLLAISGMHMGTVCGILFLGLRRAFSLVKPLSDGPWAMRLSVIAALTLTSIYWLFSGMAYSATRAWLMAVLLFAALLFYRKVISLRSVALVACLLLLIDPLALGDVGFQMSFAATAALIGFFSRFRVERLPGGFLLKTIIGLLLTSAVAGFATAPFSAFHFNNVPKYGLLANLLAVPVMTFIVLPAGIIMMFLTPFGLEAIPMQVAGWGMAWIVKVAAFVSSLPEAVWSVPAAPPITLPLIAIGGIIILIGGLRLGILGCGVLLIALLIWPHAKRADLFIADDARFFGLRAEDGPRQFSRATGHAFIAEIWAKRDGDAYDQEKNALAFDSDPAEIALDEKWRLIFSTTKKGAKAIANDPSRYCTKNTLIIAAQAKRPQGSCIFYDEFEIAKMGGMGINIDDELEIIPNINLARAPWIKAISDNAKSDSAK